MGQAASAAEEGGGGGGSRPSAAAAAARLKQGRDADGNTMHLLQGRFLGLAELSSSPLYPSPGASQALSVARALAAKGKGVPVRAGAG